MNFRAISIFVSATTMLIGNSIASEVQFSYGGQFRVRNENREMSSSASDRRNQTQLRARLELEASLPSGTVLYIAPQGSKNYGEIEYQSTSATSNTARETSGDRYHSRMELFEAYAKRSLGNLTYKIGRQAMGYGDRIILGTRNWTPGGMSYDALKLTYKLGVGEIDLAYAQNALGAANSTDDDSILSFLYYKVFQQKNLNLDVYFIHNNDRDYLELKNFGFRYFQKFGSLDFKTENIFQVQSQTDKKEHNLNFEIGHQFNQSLRSYLSYMQASKNFDQLYTNRHLYNGIVDVVGRKNLIRYELGTKYKINQQFNLSLQFMRFNQKDNSGAYNQATTAIIGGDVSKEHIGDEIDLIAVYKIDPNERLSFALAVFEHGDYFQNNPDISRFGYLQYLLKF